SFTAKSVKLFKQTNYDLTLVVEPQTSIAVNFEYNPVRYSHDVIARLMSQLSHVLDHIAEDNDVPFERIDILSTEEKRELLEQFNDTKVTYQDDTTVVDLFSQQVVANPDKIAVSYRSKTLTYRELDEKSNQLATVLGAFSLVRDGLVGIL